MTEPTRPMIPFWLASRRTYIGVYPVKRSVPIEKMYGWLPRLLPVFERDANCLSLSELTGDNPITMPEPPRPFLLRRTVTVH